MDSSVRSLLLHGVAWNFMEKILMRGFSFVIGIILARLLTPSDFGLIGMLTIFISVSNVFIEGGFAKALIQKQNCQEIDFATAFITNVVVSIIIYVILYICAPWISEFFNEPILTDLTRVLSINFVLGSFNVVQRAKLMANVDFKSLAQINVISTIISGALGIYMAYRGLGVWALAFQQIASTIIYLFIFPFYSHWKPSIMFSKESFNELFSFGSKLVATGFVSVIMNNVSVMCIGKFYRSGQLGYYTRSLQFSDIIAITVNEVLGSVTFPVLSKLQDNRAYLTIVYKKSLFFTALIIFPIMILCALLSRPLVLILLTEKWLPCVVLMQWLFVTRIIYPLSAINLNLLNALGRSDLFMKVDFSKIPMNLLALAITIPLGVKAIVIGLFCTSYIAFFLNSYYPGKLIGYGALQQIIDWKYIIISTCIMSMVVISYMHLVSNVWLQLIGGGIIGFAVYVLCCFFFKIIDKDLLQIIKKRIYNG